MTKFVSYAEILHWPEILSCEVNNLWKWKMASMAVVFMWSWGSIRNSCSTTLQMHKWIQHQSDFKRRRSDTPWPNITSEASFRNPFCFMLTATRHFISADLKIYRLFGRRAVWKMKKCVVTVFFSRPIFLGPSFCVKYDLFLWETALKTSQIKQPLSMF